jgi:fibronectin type 3 domain-containing protein
VSGTGYALSGATPATLNPSQSLTFGVIFDPTTTGTLSGSVKVTSNAAGSPATIALSGTGLQAVSHSVSLTWTDSDSTVSGFNVYRSTTSGSGYVKINASLVPSTNYTDSTVQNGTNYFYVTTAVDSTGSESGYSNEAPATIP